MNWSALLSADRTGKSGNASGPDELRSTFEQDFDRIIFSHPFRRLQDKTQVHPLPEHDFVHTRLTHSLEVSSVGRSLGRLAGKSILERHVELKNKFSAFDVGAIVAAASLIHDIGNPPFGHTGEEAISEFFKSHPAGTRIKELVSKEQWADLERFEGNAQGFRMISRQQYGLLLTAATRGAFIKYPCPSYFSRDPRRRSHKKYGYFNSENQDFKALSDLLEIPTLEAGVTLRHPLAFLVEAADDICYSIIDLEDGCRLGLVNLKETIELLAEILGDQFDAKKLEKVSSLNEKLSILRSMAIGRLTLDAASRFVDFEKQILDGAFDKALVDEGIYKKQLETIQTVSIERIYHAPHVTEIEAAGFEILPTLMETFSIAAFEFANGSLNKKHQVFYRLLSPECRKDIEANKQDNYSILRAVIDFVSGLTDRHALGLFRKIKGIVV